MDPNGNGRNDEIPLISNESSYTLQSYNYLLNAYIYNDPYHMRMCAGENGELYDASIQPAFREGLSYCARLYKEGLLSKSCVSFSKRQLQELLNSSDDVVGAFSSQSIADIIYPNCSDILARFIQVPPLKGPDGEQYAVHVNSEIQIGGYIPSNAIHKKEAFEIMDLMLSTDASLIASFGEEGVDWRQSDSGELSSYGSKAKVTTLNYLNDKVQNKHFAGSGPMVLSLEYANGVTWNGNSSLVQYIDARAVRLYEKYYYDKMELYSHNKLISQGEVTKIQSFTNDWIYRFIFGLEEIDSDEVWEGYIRERSKLD